MTDAGIPLAPIAAVAFGVWLATMVLTGTGVFAYIARRGDPTGWRFNHHGARVIPAGHASFYPREGEGEDRTVGVVLKPVLAFPLFWTVHSGRSRSDLETLHCAPVWSAIPWAYRWMADGPEDSDGRGLICTFCWTGGFETQDELEEHIDSHPYTSRRGES